MLKNIGRRINRLGINIIMRLPSSRFREIIVIIYFFLIHPLRMLKKINVTINTLKHIKEKNLSLYQTSKRSLFKYCLRETDVAKCNIYMQTYKKQNVNPIQQKIDMNLPDHIPIFISAVKNDLHRVKMQVKHHCSIGIKNFVYIDNMSDDGTFEWLVGKGIDVYRVDDEFSATAKNAWIRQITDIYGYNRWYLILDSDELFVYPGMEVNPINKLIEFAEKQQLDYFQSFMIDMYSKNDINTAKYRNLKEYDIKKNNCFFDTDSYFINQDYKGTKIMGGPRYRIFSESGEIFTPLLTKNSLLYLREEDLFSVHHSIPFHRNFNNKLISGLLHYKFLPGDNEKYQLIAEKGNYANGSIEYKKYVKITQKMKELSFYYSGSQKFNSSFDLLKINIFDEKYSKRLVDFFKESN